MANPTVQKTGSSVWLALISEWKNSVLLENQKEHFHLFKILGFPLIVTQFNQYVPAQFLSFQIYFNIILLSTPLFLPRTQIPPCVLHISILWRFWCGTLMQFPPSPVRSLQYLKWSWEIVELYVHVVRETERKNKRKT